MSESIQQPKAYRFELRYTWWTYPKVGLHEAGATMAGIANMLGKRVAVGGQGSTREMPERILNAGYGFDLAKQELALHVEYLAQTDQEASDIAECIINCRDKFYSGIDTHEADTCDGGDQRDILYRHHIEIYVENGLPKSVGNWVLVADWAVI